MEKRALYRTTDDEFKAPRNGLDIGVRKKDKSS